MNKTLLNRSKSQKNLTKLFKIKEEERSSSIFYSWTKIMMEKYACKPSKSASFQQNS